MPDLPFGDFHFLRPIWLVGIPVALYLAWRFGRRAVDSTPWRRAIEPNLLAALLEPGATRAGRRVAVLLGVGLTTACLALAGPTWQRLPQPVEQSRDALVIVLDLSLSMLAEDLKPSRIARARNKVIDVLRHRAEGQTALVVFAGDAHTVAPLTDDVHTIENLLSVLSPDMMPVLGSNPGEAIVLARQLFSNAGLSRGRILLVTDGVDRIGEVSSQAAREFPISVIGVGTEAGASIPLDFLERRGQKLTDDRGQTVIAKLDSDRLATVATICFGRYATLSVDDSDIDRALATVLPGRDETMAVDREFDTWSDAGYWLAAALVPLLLLGFRRGVLLTVCIMAVPSHAGWWDDLWLRRDQQAYRAMRDGEPDRAATLFDDTDWRGVAHYRGHSFDAAEREFGATQNDYNRGNALAHLGRYADAIAAYDAALAKDPNDADAKFNKALIERLLEEQQQQAANENRQARRNEGNSAEQEAQPNDATQDPQQAENQGEQPEQAPSESQQSKADREQQAQELAERDEEGERDPRDDQQDSLEQWLRRVPDDPGGLLRRKFQYETNQRLREGASSSHQRDQIW
jgi:Ca-activated chloride channel family protein